MHWLDGDRMSGIIADKYALRYREHGGSSGDELAKRLRGYLFFTAKNGRERMDRAKLVRFAKANGMWDEKYARLNDGQVRMNVSNKVRARLRRGAKVNWAK